MAATAHLSIFYETHCRWFVLVWTGTMSRLWVLLVPLCPVAPCALRPLARTFTGDLFWLAIGEAGRLVTLILCDIITCVVLEQGVSRDPLLF